MLGKLLVGLIVVATVAVGGYYYLDTPANPEPTAAPTVAKRSCCSHQADTVAIAETASASAEEGCCALESATTCRGPEVLAVAPRVVESELAPLPREAVR